MSRRKSGVRKRRRAVPVLKSDRYAREYEQAMILRDIHAHPGEWVTAKELRLFAPGRYSVKLKGALKRMKQDRLLEGKASRFFDLRAEAYRITPVVAEVMEDVA